MYSTITSFEYCEHRANPQRPPPPSPSYIHHSEIKEKANRPSGDDRRVRLLSARKD